MNFTVKSLGVRGVGYWVRLYLIKPSKKGLKQSRHLFFVHIKVSQTWQISALPLLLLQCSQAVALIGLVQDDLLPRLHPTVRKGKMCDLKVAVSLPVRTQSLGDTLAIRSGWKWASFGQLCPAKSLLLQREGKTNIAEQPVIPGTLVLHSTQPCGLSIRSDKIIFIGSLSERMKVLGSPAVVAIR